MLYENKSPAIISRSKITESLFSGLLILDTMIPIGRGQRELIIGDRGLGKSNIAMTASFSQLQFSLPIICIYVTIGLKRSVVLKIITTYLNNNTSFFSIILCAICSDSAAIQYLSPYAGTALAECFRDAGVPVLLIYDDLTKHATAYRQLSLLLRRPPGREAYPGDIFYLHSRLLERAAKLSRIFFGGSITALPIIETQAGDVSAYIPTNVISITDGQIFLESLLFYSGTKPAVSVGLSVSRVGSAAQYKIIKKVAGTLKLEIAQFREISFFLQYGTEVLDISARYIIERGSLLLEVLKQSPQSPFSVIQEIILIYAAIYGFFDRCRTFLYSRLMEITIIKNIIIAFANICSEDFSMYTNISTLINIIIGNLVNYNFAMFKKEIDYFLFFIIYCYKTAINA